MASSRGNATPCPATAGRTPNRKMAPSKSCDIKRISQVFRGFKSTGMLEITQVLELKRSYMVERNPMERHRCFYSVKVQYPNVLHRSLLHLDRILKLTMRQRARPCYAFGSGTTVSVSLQNQLFPAQKQ